MMKLPNDELESEDLDNLKKEFLAKTTNVEKYVAENVAELGKHAPKLTSSCDEITVVARKLLATYEGHIEELKEKNEKLNTHLNDELGKRTLLATGIYRLLLEHSLFPPDEEALLMLDESMVNGSKAKEQESNANKKQQPPAKKPLADKKTAPESVVKGPINEPKQTSNATKNKANKVDAKSKSANNIGDSNNAITSPKGKKVKMATQVNSSDKKQATLKKTQDSKNRDVSQSVDSSVVDTEDYFPSGDYFSSEDNEQGFILVSSKKSVKPPRNKKEMVSKSTPVKEVAKNNLPKNKKGKTFPKEEAVGNGVEGDCDSDSESQQELTTPEERESPPKEERKVNGIPECNAPSAKKRRTNKKNNANKQNEVKVPLPPQKQPSPKNKNPPALERAAISKILNEKVKSLENERKMCKNIMRESEVTKNNAKKPQGNISDKNKSKPASHAITNGSEVIEKSKNTANKSAAKQSENQSQSNAIKKTVDPIRHVATCDLSEVLRKPDRTSVVTLIPEVHNATDTHILNHDIAHCTLNVDASEFYMPVEPTLPKVLIKLHDQTEVQSVASGDSNNDPPLSNGLAAPRKEQNISKSKSAKANNSEKKDGSKNVAKSKSETVALENLPAGVYAKKDLEESGPYSDDEMNRVVRVSMGHIAESRAVLDNQLKESGVGLSRENAYVRIYQNNIENAEELMSRTDGATTSARKNPRKKGKKVNGKLSYTLHDMYHSVTDTDTEEFSDSKSDTVDFPPIKRDSLPKILLRRNVGVERLPEGVKLVSYSKSDDEIKRIQANVRKVVPIEENHPKRLNVKKAKRLNNRKSDKDNSAAKTTLENLCHNRLITGDLEDETLVGQNIRYLNTEDILLLTKPSDKKLELERSQNGQEGSSASSSQGKLYIDSSMGPAVDELAIKTKTIDLRTRGNTVFPGDWRNLGFFPNSNTINLAESEEASTSASAGNKSRGNGHSLNGRKSRRNRKKAERVTTSEDIEGYRGDMELDDIINFIEKGIDLPAKKKGEEKKTINLATLQKELNHVLEGSEEGPPKSKRAKKGKKVEAKSSNSGDNPSPPTKNNVSEKSGATNNDSKNVAGKKVEATKCPQSENHASGKNADVKKCDSSENNASVPRKKGKAKKRVSSEHVASNVNAESNKCPPYEEIVSEKIADVKKRLQSENNKSEKIVGAQNLSNGEASISSGSNASEGKVDSKDNSDEAFLTSEENIEGEKEGETSHASANDAAGQQAEANNCEEVGPSEKNIPVKKAAGDGAAQQATNDPPGQQATNDVAGQLASNDVARQQAEAKNCEEAGSSENNISMKKAEGTTCNGDSLPKSQNYISEKKVEVKNCSKVESLPMDSISPGLEKVKKD